MSRILATDVLLLSRVLNLGHHGITMLAHIVSRLLHLTMLISGVWNMNQFLLQMSNTSLQVVTTHLCQVIQNMPPPIPTVVSPFASLQSENPLSVPDKPCQDASPSEIFQDLRTNARGS